MRYTNDHTHISTPKLLTTILTVSYVLNYIWETVHETFLYEISMLSAKQHALMILEASLDDALIIVCIYLFIAALWRDINWLDTMNKSQIITAATAGILAAVFIELRAVIIHNTWSYQPAMPTVFGIGLSPLVQLAVTGPLSFWITGRLLYSCIKPS